MKKEYKKCKVLKCPSKNGFTPILVLMHPEVIHSAFKKGRQCDKHYVITVSTSNIDYGYLKAYQLIDSFVSESAIL